MASARSRSAMRRPRWPYGLVAEQRAVGPHDGRCRRRSVACVVDGREKTAVLGCATERSLLMKRVRGIREDRRPVRAGLGFVEVRMKHDVRPAFGCPPHSFRISPAFVADGHAERQWTSLKDAPARPSRIRGFLRWIDLDLVLETGDGAVSIDHERRDQQSLLDDTLGAQHHRDMPSGCRPRNLRPRPFEKTLIGRR